MIIMEEKLQFFCEFVKTCDEHNQYIGQGNPTSNILIVGMEPAIGSGNPKEEIRGNIEWVKECMNTDIQKLYCMDLQRTTFKGNHTWKVYQKLIDFIKEGHSTCGPFLDFGKFAFATEMNNWTGKRKIITSTNINTFKNVLEERRKLFKDSKFIQSFPVTILACSNYIVNNDEDRQIDNTFDVTYDTYGEHRIISPKGKAYHFWTHHSSDGKRLVVHTRQLSTDIPTNMIEKLAETINAHLINIENKSDLIQ
jgi:hypothetical protein